MTAHPYPKKVRQAAAETVARQILVMKDWCDLNSQTQCAFLTDADEILAALWEASRVDTLSEVESLLPNTLLYTAKTQPRTFMMAGGVAMKQDPDLLPAHIIHWGDQA